MLDNPKASVADLTAHIKAPTIHCCANHYAAGGNPRDLQTGRGGIRAVRSIIRKRRVGDHRAASPDLAS